MDNERASLIKQYNHLKAKHDDTLSFRKSDSYKTTFQTVSLLIPFLLIIIVLLAYNTGRKSKKYSCKC